MIPFTRPTFTGNEERFVIESMRGGSLSGDGPFSRLCHDWFKEMLQASAALLTPSCTHALEMAALLLDIKAGDEVIMPSFTFVSTANAFALRGATIVFIDVDPLTLNIDVELVEQAITARTRAIVPVHYAGMCCDMTALLSIAARYGLYVIEDAAQAMMSTYRGRPMGSLGHLAAFSFHATKNYTSGGEGGLLIVNDSRFAERAEILREKGTNRSQFFRGAVDKYSWVDIGSSYLLSDLQAAYLWGQLQQAKKINSQRLDAWDLYTKGLSELASSGRIICQSVPAEQNHNAHMFFVKTGSLAERAMLIEFLRAREIQAAFHYVPLHTSIAGRRFGRFSGADRYTTIESERLLRLPLWSGITAEEQEAVIEAIREFYK